MILIIILVVGLISSAYRSNFGPVRQIESIAIGGGYSISLNATPAHPMLAEYKQSITLYGGTPRGGENLGNIEIPMNTGGRIRIGVLVPNNFTTKDVILADRYLTTSVNLMSQKTRNIGSWRDGNLKAIGIISGESYPIKFIPCSVWPLLSSEEQEHILRPGDELEGFCDKH